MGGEAAGFAGTYSYIEMYEGTPELHPVTAPDNDDDNAPAGAGTSVPQAIAVGSAMRHANVETGPRYTRLRDLDMSRVPSAVA
jgi:hypothetical protein